MKVLIAEHDDVAATQLERVLLACEPSAVIAARHNRVEQLISYFKGGETADLLLLDVQLQDGPSFELFDKVDVNVPVVFVSSIEHYARHAFRYLSIDYILKPIREKDLDMALRKLTILKSLLTPPPKTKERFVIKSGNKLVLKNIADAAYFYADGKSVYMVMVSDKRKYLIDYSLEELDRMLDKSQFFRISRKFIVSISAIIEMKVLPGSRFELKLAAPSDLPLQVSRERSHEFRTWLDQ